MVNKMKKVLIGLIIAISTLCLTACMGPKTYEEISYGELQDKINNKDDIKLIKPKLKNCVAWYRSKNERKEDKDTPREQLYIKVSAAVVQLGSVIHRVLVLDRKKHARLKRSWILPPHFREP